MTIEQNTVTSSLEALAMNDSKSSRHSQATPATAKLSPSSSFATFETCSASAATNTSALVVQNYDTDISQAFATFETVETEILRPYSTFIRGFDSLRADDANFSRTNTKFIPIIECIGGSDKDSAGHRRDSIPIANAIADAEDTAQSALYFYLDDNNGQDDLAKRTNAVLRRHLLHCCTGIVVRVNPGQLPPPAQTSLDAMLVDLSEAGIVIMSTPEVMRKMGAKDSLYKIRNIPKCGLVDTSVFYDAPSFQDGFCKSIAFRPRVVKQNRGSQGEGIWICKLKDETKYCDNFGDAIVDLDTELVLMEANDNHVENHTVAEFLEFCINGRTDKAGVWESQGKGRYLDGKSGMLVDQRFLPRIVEGEVRCLMVGQQLVSLVHKVPKSGGFSATLQSGAKYTTYKPDHPKFASLVSTLNSELEGIMAALEVDSKEPFPLLWTIDYIFGDKDEHGDDTFYVGEFNCSCVGITQQMDLVPLVGKTAVEACIKMT